VLAATEIFVPRLQYAGGYTVALSAGSYEQADERQILIVRGPADEREVTLSIAPRSARS
jgi:hypothetical protein